ncbi:hypothetical protein DH2020_032025 [Rehmannia glutinosa]|uniref:Protein kinase domain-containing protein n=1 Tax=Rehmannia glutinosa TaxID=99300 RepID=A0ABR0VIM4_REHGL
MALAISMSMPGCPEKCGNITIPYPFGIGSECSANPNFTVICENSTNPPTPFLSIYMEALNISMLGTVIVNQPVSPLKCSDVLTTQYLSTSLLETPFTISADYNSLAVLGCQITVLLQSETKGSIVGCKADCDANSTDTRCNGVNCCRTTIPGGLQELRYTYQSIRERANNSFCGYAFPVESEWLREDYTSANSNFTVLCHNSTNPPRALLSSINLEALNISMLGTVIVNQPVSPLNCSDVQTTQYLATSLLGTPFTISAKYNSLAVLGCQNLVWLRANATATLGGCMAICDENSTDTRCNGVNCCETTIPPRLQELKYTYQSINRANTNNNSSSCGYAFPVESKWLQKDYTRYKGLQNHPLNPFDQEFGSAPLVLEWEFYDFETYNDSSQACRSPSSRENLSPPGNHYVSSERYCSCYYGFEGNPYLPGGCIDIDECIDATLNHCINGTCINIIGYYTCRYPDDYNNIGTRIKIPYINIGSAVGALLFLFAAWMSTKAIRKKIKANRKHKFFKRNGGLLLQPQLSATDNGLNKTKLFSSKELAKATDHYNENRILGRWPRYRLQGNVDGWKNCGGQEVQEGRRRNVVKLLGCCLETEVPLLVYEFIPNGTLFQHIHDPNEEFPLSWEIRLRIAREIAGALSYLHSAASAPIYHRDIKSTNILLDDKYRAKVSDFGTSRSVAIDQTHLTTRVLGTFGYLDPEYFRSSHFTEKSDVYSFGVVMVELLTGEKAITSVRVEEGKSLVVHFLHSMEENQLFEILDPRVLREGSKEEIVGVAELSRRCLNLNGKRRPTMKEVSVELEGIQMLKKGSVVMQNHKDDTIDVDESCDFSSMSASMDLDTDTAYSPDAPHRPLLDEP